MIVIILYVVLSMVIRTMFASNGIFNIYAN